MAGGTVGVRRTLAGTINWISSDAGHRQRKLPDEPPVRLELLSVEGGENVAQMIMLRRAVLKRAKAAQEIELLAAEQGDIDDGLGDGQHGKQAEEQDLLEPIGDLALLARVIQILEMTQENHCLVKCGAICRRPSANRGRYGFSTLSVCHALLHPIALVWCLIPIGTEGMAEYPSQLFRVSSLEDPADM